MDFCTAFDLTLKKFEIKATEIAEVAGVPDTDISKFRNNKQDIQAKRLEKLIKALPLTARNYFWLISNLSQDELDYFT